MTTFEQLRLENLRMARALWVARVAELEASLALLRANLAQADRELEAQATCLAEKYGEAVLAQPDPAPLKLRVG